MLELTVEFPTFTVTFDELSVDDESFNPVSSDPTKFNAYVFADELYVPSLILLAHVGFVVSVCPSDVGFIYPLSYAIVVDELELNLNACKLEYISFVQNIIQPDLPRSSAKSVYVLAMFLNFGPNSSVVIAVVPQPENISVISVTLPVSNLSPKFKLVIALCPHIVNIFLIFSTLLVSNLSPKSKLVIATRPQV